ncbi:DNA (cytosine-5-)-methyltransferase [Rhizobium sp. CFBP 13726]|uniref:DNA cytosine methyltransferase n=1 Tax=Rhizobium sp. CFBP 13726 TaxID=2775296 RepID=UPI0017828A2F|nr:DNA (cytosine-5-)-methyltransferase [Rhizobium sp. CFBP 13726]MBD8653944.1 DNA (cytosine-5-)-methyltransferase [Rhizobium sp. CFBP 13726]
MRIASLFSGAGGFELGFARSHDTIVLNDIASNARDVLRHRFPEVALIDDVRSIQADAIDTADMIVAGFPCQDVSIVGGQRGLAGTRSALVEHVFRLAAATRPSHILLENVQSIRFVHGGRVLLYLMHAAEQLGYSWAYRTLDSRAFGLPQRRRRFYFMASRDFDPGEALLSDAGNTLPANSLDLSLPVGFYWTEGRSGHGLTADAIPPLKTGSSIGIPSPPAVLFPDGGVKVPTIETAERFQGFPEGWTEAAPPRLRWGLVGNAVSVPVVRWISDRMNSPAAWDRKLSSPMPDRPMWPLAAWGNGRGLRLAVNVQEAPNCFELGRISYGSYTWADLSDRALNGFVKRARESRLRYPEGFLERLDTRLR